MSSLNLGYVDKENSTENCKRPLALNLEGLDETCRVVVPQSARAGKRTHMSVNTFKCLTTRNTERKFFASQSDFPLPNSEPTKCAIKRNGIVKSYAANTNQGPIRNYNEDRVSIILNIVKPPQRNEEVWPRCSFFGVFDGHGGSGCADYLRDNLHQFVIKEDTFPWNPKEAIKKGFAAAERAFTESVSNIDHTVSDRSGSCAVVLLVVGDMVYCANVGDSRAVMSSDLGSKVFPLTKDHKPNEENESKRILVAGGKVYQTQSTAIRNLSTGPRKECILGPHRVFPGRLSVSRTFGDVEAKLTRCGGLPGVITATPDIKAFRLNDEYEFVLLASDGVFDKMSNREVLQTAWSSVYDAFEPNIHQQCCKAVEAVLKAALVRRSLDNVTCVMVAFPRFKEQVKAIHSSM